MFLNDLLNHAERESIKRSKNPDLLFPDIMRKRVFSTTKHWLINKNELPRTFDRLTVFATHRCNFKCKYCNGPHMEDSPLRDDKIKDMLDADLSFKDFTNMVESILNKGSKI